MKKKAVLRVALSTGTFTEFLNCISQMGQARQSSCVYVANVHMTVEAWHDNSYAKVINAADIITPDGMPMVKCLELFYGIKQDRIDGMRLFPELLKHAENKGLSVFFYGSTLEVLDAILDHVRCDYPNLTIAGHHSPPFRPHSHEEKKNIIRLINESMANIVFVALGCPKQEKWIDSMKGKVNAVMIGVGGAFPVYAGLQKRAPEWMQKASLEWLFRLYQEPRRLFKRYLITNSIFLFLITREILSKHIFTKCYSSNS